MTPHTWIVAQTEPMREHLVRLLIMRHRLETWMPRIRVRGQKALLFPGYCFVRLELGWYHVAKTPHVIRLLPSNEQPHAVPEDILRDLRRRERDGYVRLPRINGLVKGQQVRIIGGSLEGSLAIYDGQSARDRERVLVELLGRCVPVELPSTDLVPIPNHKMLRVQHG